MYVLSASDRSQGPAARWDNLDVVCDTDRAGGGDGCYPGLYDTDPLFSYDVALDVRDLISVDDVMGENKGWDLIDCTEYLLENLTWLHEKLEELLWRRRIVPSGLPRIVPITLVPIMRQILDQMMSVFCVDETFMGNTSNFISGSLLSLSATIDCSRVATHHVLTKCDLVGQQEVESMLNIKGCHSQLWEIEEEKQSLVDRDEDEAQRKEWERRRRKRYKLVASICSLLDDYTMASFVPLNLNDEDNIDHDLKLADHTIQIRVNAEFKENDG